MNIIKLFFTFIYKVEIHALLLYNTSNVSINIINID